MEEKYLHTKLEEIIKRLEKVEALNKEQQLAINKLTRDLEKEIVAEQKYLDEIMQIKNNIENRLDQESEVTKMNPWKPKYLLKQK
jgi:hypothetical protein